MQRHLQLAKVVTCPLGLKNERESSRLFQVRESDPILPGGFALEKAAIRFGK